MFYSIFNSIKSFLLISPSNKYKQEFFTGIIRINVTRAKFTSITFIVLEVMQLIALIIIKKDSFLKKPDICYGAMYILLLITMMLYLLMFVKFEKNISRYGTIIQFIGISFTSFILFWCAGISLLDQLSSGQVIVYTVAIIAVAVTPIFEPVTLLIIYLIIHTLFFILLPYFQKSSEMLFENYINSTTFLIISWVISCMRYKTQLDDFKNRKILQEKSDELERLNKELEEANQKLKKLSQTDSLTGIFNRHVFDRTIKSEWDRCRRHFIPLSLIMIDVDFFKAFNDNYGHQAGDNCLRQISGVLAACAKRSSDTVSRYGGEEFAIILTHMKKENLLEFAEQILKKVEQLDIPHIYSSISDHVTISLGAHTVIPSNSLSIQEFIKTADKALYEAKKDRNTIVIT